MRVAEQAQFAELSGEGIVGHQTANQGIADAEQEFDRLGRLEQTDDTGQYAQHAGFRAAWRKRGRRRLGIEAAIARPLVRLEDGQLTLEAEDAAVHDRFVGDERGIVQQVARREVIGAVDDDIVVGDDARHVAFIQTLDVGDDLDIGVQGLDAFARGLGLILTNATRIMDNLALQVALFHHVGIDDADACRRQPQPGSTPPGSQGHPRRSTARANRAA